MNKPVGFIGRLSGSLLKYLVAGILIFIPLYPKFPLFNIPGTYVAIRAEDFLIGLASLTLFVHLLSRRFKPTPPLLFPMAVFFGIGLLSLFSAIFVTHSVITHLSLLHFARRIEYIICFYLLYYVASEHLLNRRFLMQLFLVPTLGVFLFGVGQLYFDFPVISTMNEEFSKGIALTMRPGVQLASTFSGHYDLAIYLAMMLTIMLAWFCLLKSKPLKIVAFIWFVALLWLFVQAGSRIGYFGLTLATLTTPIILRKPKLGLIFSLLVMSSVLLSPNLTSRILNLFKVVELKLHSAIFNPVFAQEIDRPIQQDRSTSIRFDVEWPRAMRSFYKNPFLGTGYSSISLATDNEYLRALGETGILGLVAFASIIIALYRGLVSRLHMAHQLDQVAVSSAIGILLVMTVSALFLDVFAASKIAIMFWSFMGYSFASKS